MKSPFEGSIPQHIIDALRRTPSEFQKEFQGEFPAPTEKKEIYIVARDLRTAHLYSGWHRHHIENNPDIVFKYVGHENDLRGRENIDIYLVTTWRQHERSLEIKEVVDILVQSGRATVKEVEW